LDENAVEANGRGAVGAGHGPITRDIEKLTVDGN
jgi:hypothetical protein